MKRTLLATLMILATIVCLVPAVAIAKDVMTFEQAGFMVLGTSHQKSVEYTWNVVPGATKYEVYQAKCGTNDYKCIKDTDKTSFTKKKLKEGTTYKAYVVAYNDLGDKIARTIVVHNMTKNGNRSNATEVTAKTSVKIEYGRKTNIEAFISDKDSKKKVLGGKHCAKIRYRTADSDIATIDKKGNVYGAATGTTKVYAIAASGARAVCKVVVVEDSEGWYGVYANASSGKKAKHKHNYGQWIIYKEPDCVNTGLKYCVCSGCNKTKTEKIPALGHLMKAVNSDGEIVEIKDCTVEDLDYYFCERCGKYFLDEKGKDEIHVEWPFIIRNENDASNTTIVRLTKKAKKLGESKNTEDELYTTVQNITIPDFVEYIADGALTELGFVKTITFKNDVNVGKDAFALCNNITEVNGGDNDIVLEDGAFSFHDTETQKQVHINATFSNCRFVIKTGRVGIDMETYGSMLTFKDCEFYINEFDAKGEPKATTTGILLRDNQHADKKSIIDFTNTKVKIKNNKDENVATLVQMCYLSPKEAFVKFNNAKKQVVMDTDTYLFYSTAGDLGNQHMTAYTNRCDDSYNDPSKYGYGSNSAYDIFFKWKSSDYYYDETELPKPTVEQETVSSIEELKSKLDDDNLANVKLVLTENVGDGNPVGDIPLTLKISPLQKVEFELGTHKLQFNEIYNEGELNLKGSDGSEFLCIGTDDCGLSITSTGQFTAENVIINTLLGFHSTSKVEFKNCSDGQHTLLYNFTDYTYPEFDANFKNPSSGGGGSQGDDETYNVTSVDDLVTALATKDDVTLSISSDVVIDDDIMVSSGKKVTINATNNAKISSDGCCNIVVDDGELNISGATLDGTDGYIIVVNYCGGANSKVALSNCTPQSYVLLQVGGTLDFTVDGKSGEVKNGVWPQEN